MRPNGWAMIAAGVAVLAYAARPLPAFVLPTDWADWWFRAVVGDTANGMALANAAFWLFIEVPILTPFGIVLVWLGTMEVRK